MTPPIKFGDFALSGVPVPPSLCLRSGGPHFLRIFWPKIPLDSAHLALLIRYLFVLLHIPSALLPSSLARVFRFWLSANYCHSHFLLKAPEALSGAQCRRKERRGGVRSELEL